MRNQDQSGYRIPENQKPCRFGKHFSDSVPMPFGFGDCSMPGFDCTYEGDIETIEVCDETNACSAYEPCDTIICEKHDIEYYADNDWCFLCYNEKRAWDELRS